MQIHGVEQRAPHIVLRLPVGRVTVADGLCTLVAAEMIEHLFVEGALATDAVHHLQIPFIAGNVGDELEEIVRLPIEAKRVQPPEHERRVADPAVAVIPVALAIRSLG